MGFLPRCAFLALLAGALPAQETIVDLRQGTDIALSVSADGSTIVMDLLGRLWRMPATGGGATPLTEEGDRARHPRYSPDGRQVVYQRRIGGSWNLWLLDIETGTRKALTTGDHHDLEPDFFADGARIVFASDRGGAFALWTLDLADGRITALSHEPGQASYPTVSDDGVVAYVLRQGDEWTLRSLSAAGTERVLLRSTQTLAAPSWRPGGGVLIFNQHGDGTSRLRMLILSEQPVIKDLTEGEDVFSSRAHWISPAHYLYTADGQIWRRGIAELRREPVHLFASLGIEDLRAPPPREALEQERPARGIAGLQTAQDGRSVFVALGDLWLGDEDGLEQLTDDAFVETDPIFTPEEDAVIFASDRGGGMDLWRIDLQTRQSQQLTVGPGKAYAPAVDSSGLLLAYLATNGFGEWAEAQLRVVRLTDSRNFEVLTGGLTHAQRPQWSPQQAGELSIEVQRSMQSATPAVLRFNEFGRLLSVTNIDTAQQSATASATATATARPSPETVPMLQMPEPPADYVVQVGRLFDGTGSGYTRHVDVHVEDGRIAAIVGRGLRQLPATVYDASELTMLPGLIETHAHQSDIGGERLGRMWLALGVTTVRELADDLDEALARSEAWVSGSRLGPRLVITELKEAAGSDTRAALSDIVIESSARLLSGPVHAAFDGADPRRTTRPGEVMPRELIGRIQATDRASPQLRESSLGRQYQDVYSTIIASGRVSPTMLAATGGFEPPARRSTDMPARAFAALFSPEEQLRFTSRGGTSDAATSGAARPGVIARLVRGGARVAVATDAPAVPYGIGMHEELRLLAAAGIAHDQILRMATAEGALALGLDTQIGTLEAGKWADFVIVDGDPLARIGDTRRIRAVARAGHWLEADALIDAGEASGEGLPDPAAAAYLRGL